MGRIMVTAARLSSSERQFFKRFTDAMLANPFGEETPWLKALLPHSTASKQLPQVHFLKRLQPTLDKRLTKLDERGLIQLRDFLGSDRELMVFAYLLQIYLRFVDDLDALILHQMEAGDRPVAVSFANRLLGQLEKRGFSDDESVRYFELFFQLRRAYHFIAHDLAGNSSSMKQLRKNLWSNVFTHDLPVYHRRLWDRMEDFSTLLLGETGTGKGAAAAAMGRAGPIAFDRQKGRFVDSFSAIFVAANLSQFSEELIESELFGHRKGAFTGAVDHYQGLFAQCSPQGVLFLDEIGDLSTHVQIKLLQVLQERIYSPVGSHTHERFSGRIIAATNHSLDTLRTKGKFRDDFYYRLCSDVIILPSLRQRVAESSSELETLVAHLIRRLIGRAETNIAGIILETLEQDLPSDYPWPGNVRELEQAIRRIMLTGHYYGDTRATADTEETDLMQILQSDHLDIRALTERYCQALYQRFGTFEAVAQRTQLDRRTVKKYVSRQP